MQSGTLVTVENLGLVEAVAGFRERGGSLKPTMKVVAEGLVAYVNDEFETAGRGQWPDLAESTKKKRRGSSYEILKNNGIFAGNIFPDSGEDFAEAATSIDYAKYHVSDKPRSIIPLRNPFDIPDEAYDEATEIILAAVGAG